MKPTVPGRPAKRQHRDRQRRRQRRALAAEPIDRTDVVAKWRLALADRDHREHAAGSSARMRRGRRRTLTLKASLAATTATIM